MDLGGSVIVNGIPGAGKTTVARALAERAPLAAHLEQDEIYNLIVAGVTPKWRLAEATDRGARWPVTGRIAFSPKSPPEDFWQLDLARTHVRLLARSFSEHGVLPVIDDCIPTRGVLDEYVADLPSPVRMVVLAPPLDVVTARDAGRHKQVAAQWTHLGESMARELRDVGLWLDTGSLDVAATVDAIEARLDEALLRPLG